MYAVFCLLVNELEGLGDDFVVDGVDVGGLSGDDFGGEDEDGGGGRGWVVELRVEDSCGFDADLLRRPVDAGEGDESGFAEQRVVVDAEDCDGVWNGVPLFAAGAKDASG